jgi:hypothetical protein
MLEDLESSNHFFAVIAVGDAEGNAVCTADPAVPKPLPTMSDRLYYERVKGSKGLVIGEYAISRTTNEQVVHFAYPILSPAGEFRGFVMAAVNLGWFADTMTTQYFHDNNVEIMSIDTSGKLLYRYPEDLSELGKNVLTPEFASIVLSNAGGYRLMRGYDGLYRIYAFENVPNGVPTSGFFAVGISIMPFLPLLFLLGLLSVGSLVSVWKHVVQDVPPTVKKKK